MPRIPGWLEDKPPPSVLIGNRPPIFGKQAFFKATRELKFVTFVAVVADVAVAVLVAMQLHQKRYSSGCICFQSLIFVMPSSRSMCSVCRCACIISPGE